MSFIVFPTQNDLHGADPVGTGRIASEENLAKHARHSVVISGFEVTVNGVDNTSLDIAPGEAIINGYRVSSDAIVNTGSLVGTSTHYRIWMQLNKTANLVDSVIFRYNEGDPPGTWSNAIVLAEVEKQASGSFRNIHDRRSQAAGVIYGDHEINNNPGNHVVLGWRPSLVLTYNGVDITWKVSDLTDYGFIQNSDAEFVAFRAPD